MAYIGISRRAARDIQEIEQFSIATWGRRTANEYLRGIQDALERLSSDPSLLRTKPEFSRLLHFYRVNRHFLVCTVRDENIYVLAVKHSSMDLPTRLSELEPRLLREAEWLHKAFLATKDKR